MSISKILSLNARLLGFEKIHQQLQTLEKDALKVQAALGNVMGGKTGVGEHSTVIQIVSPIDRAVKQIKSKVPEVKAAVAEVIQAVQQYDRPIGPQHSKHLASKLAVDEHSIIGQALGQRQEFIDLVRQRREALGRTGIPFQNFFSDNTYAKPQSRQPVFRERFDLRSVNIKQLNALHAEIKEELPKGYADAYEDVRKLAYKKNEQIHKLERAFIHSEGADRKALGATLKQYYHNEVYDYKARCDSIEEANTRLFAKEKAQADRAKELVKTAFGLHIAQMYLQPITQAIQQMFSQMLTSYAEFDKKFANYVAKSKSYSEHLSKNKFFDVSVGQTYNIQEAAMAAERFAASGVDVAQNQEALTAVLQTSTSAQLDYNETANGVIRTMQAMHMDISQISQITDAMTNSANASTAELKDMISWFEYAASTSYAMGLNVNQLSSYLGILSSTGLPNTGAAFRQLMVQLSKTDIQEGFKARFSFIEDEDFRHVDKFIIKMREYVQSQADQAGAEREISQLLKGKVNAQQALGNLLMAEPALWNQVTAAANESGTTSKLYEEVTHNTADAINRIKVNLNILMSQFGSFLAPFAYGISAVVTGITKLVMILPEPVKWLIGLSIIGAAAFVTLFTGLMMLVGGFAVLVSSQTFTHLSLKGLQISFATFRVTISALIKDLLMATGAMGGFRNQIALTTVSAQTSTITMKSLWASFKGYNALLIGGTGAMLGYMTQSELMNKQMYDEARLVSTLTGLWIGLSIARMGGMHPGAIIAGAGIGMAYDMRMQDQISKLERADYANAISTRAGLDKAKTYNVNIQNANITKNGIDIAALCDEFDDGEEYY